MLKDELDAAKRAVSTDRIQISIGEIASMYTDGELDIIPDFQRLFRWSISKKTAFIESILIGIPVPPAFAFENQDGTWELIDGLQRISTILEFMGVLRDIDNEGSYVAPSVLSSAIYLPSLQGVSWSGECALEKSLQLFFRRARIEFQVLKHPSDTKTKYDLFKRLNRGGEYANEQEVRTCSMVLANKEITRRIKDIASSDSFLRIVHLSEDKKTKQKNVEYLVRAIVHSGLGYTGNLDVQDYLDRGILEIISGPNAEAVIDSVVWAIEKLDGLKGDQALIPHDQSYVGISTRFSLRALEGILVGISVNKDNILSLDNPDEYVNRRLDEFWRQQEVANLSASGLRGTTRLQRTIPFGIAWFNPL